MARRGENIHKRKDGRWEGRYIKALTPEGKIQWGYVYGAVYAEVKQVLIQKKAEAGFYNLKRTDLTFEALAEAWLHSQRNSIKESTYAHYSYILHKYLLPVLSKVPVASLEESFLEQAMQQIIVPTNAAHKPLENSTPKAVAYYAEKAARKRQQYYMVSSDGLFRIPQKPKEASALSGVEVERALGEVLEPVVLLEPFKGLLDGGVCLGSGS